MAQLGLLAGVGAFLRGIAFVVRTPRLWGHAAVPTVALVLVGTALGALGVFGSLALAERIVDGASLADGIGRALVATVLVSTALVLSFLVALTLAQPLSSGALDAICRAQAADLGAAPWPEWPLMASMGRSLRSSLVALVLWLVVTAVALGLALVLPGAGLVTGAFEVIASAWLVAWGLLDYPCGLAGLGMRRRLAWMRAHPGETFGLGLVGALFALVPLVGWVVLPFGVAGATRLFVGSGAARGDAPAVESHDRHDAAARRA